MIHIKMSYASEGPPAWMMSTHENFLLVLFCTWAQIYDQMQFLLFLQIALSPSALQASSARFSAWQDGVEIQVFSTQRGHLTEKQTQNKF